MTTSCSVHRESLGEIEVKLENLRKLAHDNFAADQAATVEVSGFVHKFSFKFGNLSHFSADCQIEIGQYKAAIVVRGSG
jgi:hypothetical protein